MADTPPYLKMPALDTNMAVVVLVINLFVPGIGTIVAGVMGEMRLIGRGIAQFFLAILFVGWIWALVNSIQGLSNAKWKENRAKAA